MRVLSIHSQADAAGVGYGMATAFRNHPTITLRSTVGAVNYLQYPADLPWNDAVAEWGRADVVHVHHTLGTWRRMGGNRPFVLHHHGTRYRADHDTLDAAVADLDGVAVASTLDLLDYGPHLTWVPQPHDLPRLATFRKPHDGPLRVGHAPTKRSNKSTDAFLSACTEVGIEPVLIERRSWADCLAVKGTCDVLFDQTKYAYGSNSIEAWGMGIPVIAGANPATIRRMRDVFGELPFYETTETTIAGALRAMTDPDVQAEYARRGIAHAQRWHDGHETVARLTPIYERLAA